MKGHSFPGVGLGAGAAGLSILSASGGTPAPKPADCSDNSVGCKLSHTVANVKMVVQLLLVFLLTAVVIYLAWTFAKSVWGSRKR